MTIEDLKQPVAILRSTDEVTLSPTGQARCRICGQNIPKNSVRIDRLVPSASAPGKYNRHKFHRSCTFDIDGVLLRKEAETRSAENLDRAVLHERRQLSRELKFLRRLLQHNNEYSDSYYVFTNKMLDQLVLKLPRNAQQLSKISGFGEKRCDYFGEKILEVIRRFVEENVPSTKLKEIS